ncbi:hypothetical protein COP1_019349 [Malus domestica]
MVTKCFSSSRVANTTLSHLFLAVRVDQALLHLSQHHEQLHPPLLDQISTRKTSASQWMLWLSLIIAGFLYFSVSKKTRLNQGLVTIRGRLEVETPSRRAS